MKIRTFKELEQALLNATRSALEDISGKVAEITRDEIDSVVYAEPEGEYKRTYQLRNSMKEWPVQQSGNVFESEIKHDIDMIKSKPDIFQHGSRYWTPQEYSKYIPVTIHRGLSGPLFGHGHWRRPKPYMTNTVKRLKGRKEHVTEMKKSLNRQGFKTR